jgi:hypothetical protein
MPAAGLRPSGAPARQNMKRWISCPIPAPAPHGLSPRPDTPKTRKARKGPRRIIARGVLESLCSLDDHLIYALMDWMANTWIVDLRHFLISAGTLAPCRAAPGFSHITGRRSLRRDRPSINRRPCDAAAARAGVRAPAYLRSLSMKIWRACSGGAPFAETTMSFAAGRERFGILATSRAIARAGDPLSPAKLRERGSRHRDNQVRGPMRRLANL